MLYVHGNALNGGKTLQCITSSTTCQSIPQCTADITACTVSVMDTKIVLPEIVYGGHYNMYGERYGHKDRSAGDRSNGLAPLQNAVIIMMYA